MGLLEDAIADQKIKQAQRLEAITKRQKADAQRQKFGTFIGRNLTDGTAIVLLDGEANPVSGFRLISNANVVNGDRVSIRQSQGLPRADAKNIAPAQVEQQQDLFTASIELILRISEYNLGYPFEISSSLPEFYPSAMWSYPRLTQLIPTELYLNRSPDDFFVNDYSFNLEQNLGENYRDYFSENFYSVNVVSSPLIFENVIVIGTYTEEVQFALAPSETDYHFNVLISGQTTKADGTVIIEEDQAKLRRKLRKFFIKIESFYNADNTGYVLYATTIYNSKEHNLSRSLFPFDTFFGLSNIFWAVRVTISFDEFL